MNPLSELTAIVKRLRAPGGCPWDQEQTMQSITTHIIEEAYELVSAINTHNTADIREELGDVLLHVVMLSEMASEQGDFSLDSVAESACTKMIRRHPHVFGDAKADTADDVVTQWDAIKKTEKESRLFDSIPKHLPALMRAQKIQKKAAKCGFDWPDVMGTIHKLEEEVDELKVELARKKRDPKAISEESGDMLFSMVNMCRKLNISTEDALQGINEKFIARFYHMEDLIRDDGHDFETLSLDEMERYWQRAKTDLSG